jgi:hypothetical protein
VGASKVRRLKGTDAFGSTGSVGSAISVASRFLVTLGTDGADKMRVRSGPLGLTVDTGKDDLVFALTLAGPVLRNIQQIDYIMIATLLYKIPFNA